MMTEQLDHFKQRLFEEKTRLTQELNDYGKENPNEPGKYSAVYPESGSNSEDDNAMEIAEFVDDATIEARIQAELKDVDSALKAMDNGTYGICKYCKKPIDEKRLEARPASSSCISCKKVLTQEM
ncbi:MAG: TraR/DksA C4-type zinc finger protein [Patescibacteria group bacterium]